MLLPLISMISLALLPAAAHAAQSSSTAKRPPAGTPVIILTVKKGDPVTFKASGAAADTPVWVEFAPDKFTQHTVGTDIDEGLLVEDISRSKTVKIYGAITHFDCTPRGQYAGAVTALDARKNTMLHTLQCRYNQLTTVDTGANTALKKLDCGQNELTKLDVRQNTGLEILLCEQNRLLALDVRNNTALQELECMFNNLTTLDIRANTALKKVDCRYNQLTSLLVSKDAHPVIEYEDNPLTEAGIQRR